MIETLESRRLLATGPLPTAEHVLIRGSATASDVVSGSTWMGRTVAPSDTLVLHTYGGDADLNGRIDIDDYGKIDSNVGIPGSTGWSKGDFNYDGKINVDDYGVIDSGISTQGSRITTGGEVWGSIFKDEFSGTTRDPVWRSAQWWDINHTEVDGELQTYDPSALSVSNGQLHLQTRKQNLNGRQYVSGMVQTGGSVEVAGEPRFNFRFGYMEVMAQVPEGQGLWPAIWMMPASYNDGNGELDVMEILGGDPNTVYFNLHRNDLNNQEEWVGPNFSERMHTYAVDWQADKVVWYIDGIERARMTDPALICPEASYPILNVAVGGDWGGPPDSTTVLPTSMDVDYVRVWQKK